MKTPATKLYALNTLFGFFLIVFLIAFSNRLIELGFLVEFKKESTDPIKSVILLGLINDKLSAVLNLLWFGYVLLAMGLTNLFIYIHDQVRDRH